MPVRQPAPLAVPPRPAPCPAPETGAAGPLARLMVERARPDWVRRRPGAHWLVVATVCLGAFMGQLDASIVTLAFPALERSFHAGLTGVEWVSLSYLLTLVALVTAVGRFADMRGRKSLYLLGFAVFIAASAACGLAPNLPVLCLLRVVQAGGAALLQANSIALISEAMPPERLGRGLGVQGTAQAVGLALGPAVGGLLVSAGGWRLIFLVNVPVGLVGVALGLLFVPRTRVFAERAPFDWRGLALFLPACCAVVLGLSLATGRVPLVLVLALGGVAVVAGAAFVHVERTHPAPMIDLALLRRRVFGGGLASGMLSFVVLFGVLLVVPLYAAAGLGLSAGQTGLRLAVLPAALALAAPVSGRFADRHGPRLPVTSGLLVAAAGLAVLAAGPRTGPVLLVGLAVVGLGLGAFTPANNSAIMHAAPAGGNGAAGGLLTLTRGLGTAAGVAVAGLVYSVAAHPAAGAHLTAAAAGHGFGVTCLVLAAFAAAAALIGALAATPPPVRTAARRPGQSSSSGSASSGSVSTGSVSTGSASTTSSPAGPGASSVRSRDITRAPIPEASSPTLRTRRRKGSADWVTPSR
jgi:EmrB/QacA subfamily drug resistance transporter